MAELVEFLGAFGPHPGLYPQLDAEGEAIPLDPAGPLAGTVFSVKSDPHVGKICVARIHRGVVGAHDALVGPSSNERPEKLGGLFRLVGKKREPVTHPS